MSLEEQLIKAAHAGDLTGVEAALASGANVNAKGGWALRLAASNGHPEVVECLIKACANIRVEDDWALRRAACKGHLHVVESLIKAGSDAHAGDDDALRSAAEHGHIQVIERLGAAGADPDHPCLHEADQQHAALRAWLEHRRLSQSQPEPPVDPDRRGLLRVGC